VAAAALPEPNIFFQKILLNIVSLGRKADIFKMCRHSLRSTNRQQCSAHAGLFVSLSQIEYAYLNRCQIGDRELSKNLLPILSTRDKTLSVPHLRFPVPPLEYGSII